MSEEFELLTTHFQKDPYKILGLEQGASLAEIKKAYFSLIKEYSPEKNPEAFKKIRKAYELLRSQKRKQETDFLLFEDGETESKFEKPKEIFYNLQDDIVDIELWRLISADSER